MECSQCKNKQEAGRFCFKCGTALQVVDGEVQPVGNTFCRHCHQQIPSDPTHKFCMYCGKVLKMTAFQKFSNTWWVVNLVLLVVVLLTFHSELACVVSFVGLVWFFGVPITLYNLEKEFQKEEERK